MLLNNNYIDLTALYKKVAYGIDISFNIQAFLLYCFRYIVQHVILKDVILGKFCQFETNVGIGFDKIEVHNFQEKFR